MGNKLTHLMRETGLFRFEGDLVGDRVLRTPDHLAANRTARNGRGPLNLEFSPTVAANGIAHSTFPRNSKKPWWLSNGGRRSRERDWFRIAKSPDAPGRTPQTWYLGSDVATTAIHRDLVAAIA